MAAITAAVIAPSFTVIGGLITLVLLATAYPIFLLVAYGFIARRVAVRSADDLAWPFWRAALLVGGCVTLTLTLVLLVTAVVLGLALASLATVISNSKPDITYFFVVEVSFAITALYLAGAIVLGFPCAWIGAWLGMRRRPLPTAATPVGML